MTNRDAQIAAADAEIVRTSLAYFVRQKPDMEKLKERGIPDVALDFIAAVEARQALDSPKLRSAEETERALLVNWRGRPPEEVPWLEIVQSLRREIAAYVRALEWGACGCSCHSAALETRDNILAALLPKQDFGAKG